VAPRARVRLASIRQRDEKAFLAASRVSRSTHRPWVYPPETTGEYRRFVRACGETKRRFLLWSTAGGGAGGGRGGSSLVGYFSLSEITRGNLNSAYLGYWVSSAFAGQGAMSEGMEQLLRAAFKHLRLHRIEANIQPENAASIALARAAGFRLEGFSPRYLKVGGRWRDHERFAITIEDWQARPPRRPVQPTPLRSASEH
jgi:ribosomal-protein-alanine N-acetyltransferase